MERRMDGEKGETVDQNELSDLQQKVSYRELDFFYLLKLRSNWYQKKLEQNLLMVPTEDLYFRAFEVCLGTRVYARASEYCTIYIPLQS